MPAVWLTDAILLHFVISSCILVSFPLVEPLIRQFVKFFEARKATDFLEKSAAKLIEARKTKCNGSALVS